MLRAAINSYGDLAGCKLSYFKTFEKYLDAANTTRYNIMNYSQDFSQATWVKFATSVVSNSTLAPDGTMTADTILDNSVNSQHYVSANAVVATYIAGKVNVSVYLKYAGMQYALPWVAGSSTAGYGGGPVVDLLNGTIVGVNNDAFVTNETITDVGNGWYLVKFTCSTISSLTARVYVNSSPSTSSPAYIGTGTGCYVWGYQVEAHKYQQVDASLMTPTAATIQLNNTNPGGTDPLGSTTADVLVDTAVNSSHYAFQIINGFTTGQRVTYTMSLKPGGTITNARVQLFSSPALSSTAYAVVDLTAGTISSTLNVESATIELLTNTWRRISITVVCDGDGDLRPGVVLLGAGQAVTYTGTGAGVYTWNGQLTWDTDFKDYQVTTTTHAPFADSTAVSPTETYIVSQLVDYNPDTVTWKLVTPIDRPNVLLPRLQYLKDEVGNHVYAPGLNRIMQ